MRRPTKLAWLLPGLLAVLAAAGCGDSAGGRQAVSGTVTLKGQPLDQGNIMFLPVSGDLATQSGALITKGGYQIPRAQGLQPGKYRVAISSTDGQTPVEPDALPGPSGNFASKERIPAEFNLKSTQQVEVKRGETNKFDFNIP
jgi:hypothetical protein